MQRLTTGAPRFAVLAVLVFVGLSAIAHFAGRAYAEFFVSLGNAAVAIGPSRTARFEVPVTDPGKNDHRDIELHLVDRRLGLQKKVAISSHRHGVMPTAFLAALILATPLTWRRRMGVLAIGLVLLHAYLVLKFVFFPLAYAPLPEGTEKGLWTRTSAHLLWVVGATSAGWMMPPLLIWLLLCAPALLRQAGMPLRAFPRPAAGPDR